MDKKSLIKGQKETAKISGFPLKKTIGYDILEEEEKHFFKYFFKEISDMTDRKQRTEAFAKQGWGIFTHYIGYDKRDSNCTRSRFKSYKDWNDRVNTFNTDNYARTLHEVGANYAFFTVMQGAKYMCAPNDTFNRITGEKPGEACSERDLIADLIVSLKKYDIPLYLYFTGDGPYKDAVCGPKMGYYDREVESVNMPFVKNWTEVLKEYAVRYGKDVHGWWIDGMFEYLGYEDPALFVPYREAVLAGNPDAIIAVCGCYSQRDEQAVAALSPSITAWHNPIPSVPRCRNISVRIWGRLSACVRSKQCKTKTLPYSRRFPTVRVTVIASLNTKTLRRVKPMTSQNSPPKTEW